VDEDTDRPEEEDRASHSAYQALYRVDVRSGRCASDGAGLLVPRALAQVINAVRLSLHGQRRNDASAWREAGLIPAFELKEDVTNPHPVSRAQLTDPAAPTAPASPAKPPAAAPLAVDERARPRLPPGRRVRVISMAPVTARRKEVELRTRYSSEEKKTELKMLDALLARGEVRSVGIHNSWRTRLDSLRIDMPHFGAVIDRIEACLALAEFTRTPPRLPPILLAGPPGVGKTHFATRLAAVMGVPQFIYAMESAETTSVLSGSEKHWSTSEAGQLWKLIVLGEYANPVVVLDELDKAPRGGNQYKPASALHAVLDPLTSQQLRDKSVDLEFNASYVTYIATANRLGLVEASLRSRFELFYIDEPGPRASVAIARAICRQTLVDLKLARRFAMPVGEVVQQLAMLGGPRQMHKVLRAGLGRAVLAGRNRVTVADLFDGAVGIEAGGGHERVH
jgi:ATP-dependent Lon protease